jgi:hypothetical protein
MAALSDEIRFVHNDDGWVCTRTRSTRTFMIRPHLRPAVTAV